MQIFRSKTFQWPWFRLGGAMAMITGGNPIPMDYHDFLIFPQMARTARTPHFQTEPQIMSYILVIYILYIYIYYTIPMIFL